jgi:hypothetical protein
VWTVDIASIPPQTRVALAIGVSGRNQRHVGILYRPRLSARPRFLHLAGHLTLNDDGLVPEGFRGVLVTDLPGWVEPTLVALCKRTAASDTHDGLPYGFGYQPSTVMRDPHTGKLTLRGPSGLTCATFVLAIFDLANVQLADLTTWKDRDGDREWKERVITHLKSQLNASELEAIRRDTSSVRVRPEDAAGSATVQSRPAHFDQAVFAGNGILGELPKSQPPAG